MDGRAEPAFCLDHNRRFCVVRHHGTGGLIRSLALGHAQAGEHAHGHTAGQALADGQFLPGGQGVRWLDS